jgi:hypothetical protein
MNIGHIKRYVLLFKCNVLENLTASQINTLLFDNVRSEICQKELEPFNNYRRISQIRLFFKSFF